jgi:hypothetical protein
MRSFTFLFILLLKESFLQELHVVEVQNANFVVSKRVVGVNQHDKNEVGNS